MSDNRYLYTVDVLVKGVRRKGHAEGGGEFESKQNSDSCFK